MHFAQFIREKRLDYAPAGTAAGTGSGLILDFFQGIGAVLPDGSTDLICGNALA